MASIDAILTRRPVAAMIRMVVPAGQARPAPPVGPALGQYRLNLMTFCKEFNARTQNIKPETPMSVMVTAYKDNTFEFTVKSPSVTWYLKKAAGIQSGSSKPGHQIAGTITVKHIYEIAKVTIQLNIDAEQLWHLINAMGSPPRYNRRWGRERRAGNKTGDGTGNAGTVPRNDAFQMNSNVQHGLDGWQPEETKLGDWLGR